MQPVVVAWVPGTPELIIVLALVLILFGAGKLPQVLRQFGTGIKAFKDAQKEIDPESPPIEVGAAKEIPSPGVAEVEEVAERVRE